MFHCSRSFRSGSSDPQPLLRVRGRGRGRESPGPVRPVKTPRAARGSGPGRSGGGRCRGSPTPAPGCSGRRGPRQEGRDPASGARPSTAGDPEWSLKLEHDAELRVLDEVEAVQGIAASWKPPLWGLSSGPALRNYDAGEIQNVFPPLASPVPAPRRWPTRATPPQPDAPRPRPRLPLPLRRHGPLDCRACVRACVRLSMCACVRRPTGRDRRPSTRDAAAEVPAPDFDARISGKALSRVRAVFGAPALTPRHSPPRSPASPPPQTSGRCCRWRL